MLKSLSTYIALDPDERRGVRQALRETIAVKKILGASGYLAARDYLAPKKSPFTGNRPTAEYAVLADRAIRAFPMHLVCLERSLVVEWIAGPRAKIRLGVSFGDEYRFHAWVEMDGKVLNDSPGVPAEFLPFNSTPGGGELSRFD